MRASLRAPRIAVLVVLPVLASACSEAAHDAVTAPSTASAGAAAVEVVMSGLDSPRGLAFGPDGSLYVAEAGNTEAPGPCAAVARGSNCYSGTGAISRLRHGRQERVASGLPSVYNEVARDITGVHDISFQGGRMLVTTGWGGSPVARAQLGTIGSGLGALLQVTPAGVWRVVADLTAAEAANPDGGVLDSNPYGLLAEPSRTYAVDAGGNSLLQVQANGRVSVLATFPSQAVPPGFPPTMVNAEAVPTEVTRGPDGALYVSTLTGVPFVPGSARIFRVVPGSAPTVYASGFSMITDMDWGADGSLYVLQYASAPFLNGPGALIRVAPDGTRSTVIGGLTNPTGLLVAPDGAIYVSNRGNVAAAGEVLRIVP